MRISYAAIGAVFILFSCCSYEKEASEWVQYSGAITSPEGNRLVYLRSYRKFLRPKGLSRFPDGGRAKILENNLDLYLYDRRDKTQKKLAEVKGIASNPPSIIASWKQEAIVYWLHSSFNKDHHPPVAWAHSKGIFTLDLNTGEHHRLVSYGEAPALSPDAQTVAFLEPGDEKSSWLCMIGRDGSALERAYKIEDIGMNWISWEENGYLILYSSLSRREVYSYDIASKTLSIVDRQYYSFPPQLSRTLLKELISDKE